MQRLLLLALLTVAVAAAPARAQPFTFQFAQNGTPITALTLLATGQTAPVQVYLHESAPGTTLATQKLFSFGVRVNTPGGVAAVQSTSDIVQNPAFDLVNIRQADANSARLDAAAFTNPFVGPDALGSILLGTFTVTATKGGSATFATADPDPNASNTATGTGTVLDSQIQNASLTVTVVPEPSTLLLVGAAAVGWGVVRRRRAAPTA
jgi:hypothetical protein